MLPTPTLYIHLQRIAILYKNFAICTRPCTYSNALFTINVVSIFVRLEKIINEFYCIVLRKFILNAIYIFSCQDTISLSTYHHNFCLLHSMFLLLVHCRILFYFFSNFWSHFYYQHSFNYHTQFHVYEIFLVSRYARILQL